MKKKSFMSLLALALTLSTMLTACGSNETPAAESKEPAKSSESQKSEASTEDVEEEPEYPEYLNLDSPYPIIKEDAEPIKLTMIWPYEGGCSGVWEDLAISKILKEKYNLEFEVEMVSYDALDTRKSIMLNSGELPDIMVNLWLGTTDLVNYGQNEGLFLPINEYIDETLTPNLYYWFEHEEYGDQIKGACTTSDGNIYSAPQLTFNTRQDNTVQNYLYINTTMLKEAGIDEQPKTLEEFTEAMYAIKDKDSNVYPLCGGITDSGDYMINAFGYVGADGFGKNVVLRDGEVVIPAYDTEVFSEYLKLMNQYYNDGIVNKSYFTIDAVETNAQIVEGKTATCYTDLFALGITNEQIAADWASSYMLTSDWQEKSEITNTDSVSVGCFMISAETEYPELCMRFLDAFYNVTTGNCNEILFDAAQSARSELAQELGLACNEWDEEQGIIVAKVGYPEDAVGLGAYRAKYLAGSGLGWGAAGTSEARYMLYKEFGCPDDVAYGMSIGNEYDKEDVGNAKRRSNDENLVPYITKEKFPPIYYVDAETAQKLSDILAAINPYIEEQVALFITGARDLSETAKFAEELKALGIEQALDIYKQVYADYLAAIG